MTSRIGMCTSRAVWLALILTTVLSRAPAGADEQNPYPLAEERGTAGILAALKKLPVYVRVLHTTAHPDDESSGTLTWLARKASADTALLCLTSGDGGQNVLGDEKYEAMGLVRTGELLAACKLYGIELYFTSAFDFGFSKTADETLAKWGREEILEEMVRLIRTWRPTIILSRFQGGPGDGHGHHQAAGALTNEAFKAAADPGRFPEHLKEGVGPWQTKKLYHGRGRRSDGDDWTVRIPVGEYDPVLGRSYREIASEGHSKHRSQGMGGSFSLPSSTYDYYKLVESAAGAVTKEESLFDSIDTSLQAILELAGSEGSAVSFLKPGLTQAEAAAHRALSAFDPTNPAKSAPHIVEGVKILSGLLKNLEAVPLKELTKTMLEEALERKRKEFENAANAVLGVRLITTTEGATAIPGQKLPVRLAVFNQGPESLDIFRSEIHYPGDWSSGARDSGELGLLAPGESRVFQYTLAIPPEADPTQPFWYRENPTDSRYRVRPTRNPLAPFGEPLISGLVSYRMDAAHISISSQAKARVTDPLRGTEFVDFHIVPALSVAMDPKLGVVPISDSTQVREFRVSVSNNSGAEAKGSLRLVAPSSWHVEPDSANFALARRGESFARTFKVNIPGKVGTGTYQIEAVAEMGSREFRTGYRIITYPQIWTRHLYRPARSQLEVFDVKIAPGLRVGYVAGAGDEVPSSLEQLGVEVQMLSATDLAYGDLNRFDAIVTGIRAYNVNADLLANNQRLLGYVQQGGTLIVQYVRPARRLANRNDEYNFLYGPYPMNNSGRDRITVEEAPIEILAPEHPLFVKPNKIGAADFDGWVQERGLYLMDRWDPKYQALLSGNDPGEDPKTGGMLVARSGNGFFIYTAYAWFRQLPAGVPGAYRMFANMLSVGK